MDKYLITADIGGTTSRFASFVVTDAREVKLLQIRRFGTRDFEDFRHLLEDVNNGNFEPRLSDAALCVFAVAGAVRRGVYCAPPNIDWDVDLTKESTRFGLRRFVLINDFVAQAFSSISQLAADALPIQAELLQQETAADALSG